MMPLQPGHQGDSVDWAARELSPVQVRFGTEHSEQEGAALSEMKESVISHCV